MEKPPQRPASPKMPDHKLEVEESKEHKEKVEFPKLIADMYSRAANASPKVRGRVLEAWLPNALRVIGLNQSGDDYMTGLKWKMENDFELLVKDPSHEVGGSHYVGWTSEEIQELYKVIFDEDIKSED